jgi:hypothetical protein
MVVSAWKRRLSLKRRAIAYRRERRIDLSRTLIRPSVKEALNKSIQDLSEHGRQKAWFLPAFANNGLAIVRGGTSLCRRNLCTYADGMDAPS